MKKRIDINSLICISVSLATVLSLGAMSLADELSEQEPDEETEIAYEDDTECIVEEDDEDIIDETFEEDAVIVSDFEAFEEEPEDQPEEVVLSEEDVEEVSATTGFKVSGGKIYFYDQNGKMLKGWQKIDDAWWYFTSSGAAANGWQEIGSKWYYFYSGYNEEYSSSYSYYAKNITLIDDAFYCFNEDGEMLTNSWVDDHGSWYYADKNGKAVTGWQSIGGKWYHFRDFNITEYENGGYSYDHPSMDTGFIRIGEDYYYFDENGVMQTNCWYEEKPYYESDSSSWYYIGSNGKAVTGWKKIGGKYYYFDKIYKEEYSSGYVYYSKPYMISGSTMNIDGKTYFFNNKGIMQTGWVNTGSDKYPSWYYFGSDGAAYTGWHKIGGKYYYFSDYGYMYRDGLRQIDDIYYYFDADGVLQTNKWIQPFAGDTYKANRQQSYWYYFDADGCAVIGWEEIDGKWYYFGEGSNSSSSSYYPYMRTSTVISQANKDGGYDYFVVGNDGSRQSGWAQVGNDWYYCDKNGKAYKGWHNIGGTYYYFSESYSPYMYKGLQTIDGNDYLLLDNGKMVKGWCEYKGKTYYADENGVLVKDDWVKSGGKWYYMNSSGQMVTGLYTIYNQNTGRYKLYRFDSNGVCKNP